jgi:hypothetical protein
MWNVERSKNERNSQPQDLISEPHAYEVEMKVAFNLELVKGPY